MSVAIDFDPAAVGSREPVWHPGDVLPDPADVGGKAWNLARLVAAGSPVPPFFVITADVAGSALTPALEALLASALRSLGGGPVAVRSSAVGEDGAAASFAGQFETVLGVAPAVADVWDAVRHVWASADSEHARRYLRERGQAAARMAVVVQRMVEPEAAGVAFTADPVTGDRGTAVVSAVYGLGEGLVSGALDADVYRVTPAPFGPPAIRAEIVDKPRAVRTGTDGVVREVDVPEDLRRAPAITEREAAHVAARARALAEALGGPQDVEWALARGPSGRRELWILQARPITALPPAPLAGEKRTWDNENLVESYPGVTLPLSYSVARRVFGDLYRQHCQAMGASPEALAAHAPQFRSMLGLVRGRVYYHHELRVRLLSLSPGIGERDGEVAYVPLPPEDRAGPLPPVGSLPPALFVAGQLMKLPAHLLRLTARIEPEQAEFRERAARILPPLVEQDLSAHTPDELLAVFETLERDLLAHWVGPMRNDGLLSHWMNVLGRMVKKWLPEAPDALPNELAAGDGDMASAEPVTRLRALGERVRGCEAARAILGAEPDDATALARLHGDPACAYLANALDEHLARFGDRCADELKLEARTYAEDPGFLVRTLRVYAAAPEAPRTAPDPVALRTAAEAYARERLAPAQSAAFFGVAEQVRRMTRDREAARLERTRAFGVIRRVFREMGARLAAAGVLDDARDVLYLSLDTLTDFLRGHAPGTDLRAMAAAARAEFDAYVRQPEPPSRFATHGPPSLSPLVPQKPGGPDPTPEPDPEGGLRGQGCCPGLVRAPVRVVRDPRMPGELAGRILVARTTDPGWTLLFPAVAGVLVERGSLLSHAALVARELGIPCIVGIPGLLDELADGEVVEMDGATGTVRRTAPE